MAKADAFEGMLTERGVAELQHPIYGTVKVVPTGDIEREDDPVSRLGESTVAITFTETITGKESGDLIEVAADDIDKKLNEFADAAVIDFADALNTEDITTQMSLVSALKKKEKTIIKEIDPIASADKKNYPDWITTGKEITEYTTNLYKTDAGETGKTESYYTKAHNIGRYMLRLMTMPSTPAVSLAEKINGYASLKNNIINQYKNNPFGVEKQKTAYASASLAITGACAAVASGSALTIAEIAAAKNQNSNTAGITSRENAIEAVEKIINFYEAAKEFQDEKIENINKENSETKFIDTDSAAHFSLAELVYESIQLILNASFALPMQKTITLDRDRQVIELCAELYGSTDPLDTFIMQNNLNINEIELLPMGKKVKYYVKSA
jgi:prophage DNA circulation protein